MTRKKNGLREPDSSFENDNPSDNPDTSSDAPAPDDEPSEDTEIPSEDGLPVDDPDLTENPDLKSDLTEESEPLFFDKNFEDYTVTEGLLLLIFVVIFCKFCIDMTAKFMNWRMF